MPKQGKQRRYARQLATRPRPREGPRELEVLPQRDPLPAHCAALSALFLEVFFIAVKEHIGEFVDHRSPGRRQRWVATTRRHEPPSAQMMSW